MSAHSSAKDSMTPSTSRLAGGALFFLGLVFCSTTQATDVLTQHNDPARTGANLEEKVLSPATLAKDRFGRLFSFPVTGQIYAQPLILTGVEIPGKGTRNLLFVATMRNIVYAFDADGGDALPLWQKYLGAPMPYNRIPKDLGAKLGQYNIRPFIGITSTPVVDRERQRLYVVAKIAEGECPGATEATAVCPVVYRIHALDVRNGEVLIKNDIHIPLQDPEVPAEDAARRHLQRPGLLLSNRRVYVAFGAHQDALPYNGWVINFDADTLVQSRVEFCVTPGGNAGGIWQAGNALAADTAGNIYLMTGNGDFDPVKRQFGNAFVKLNPDLAPVGWFAPANIKMLNQFDIDLGSAGPMLLPETDELVGGGKQGKLYLLKRLNLGGQQKRRWFRDQLNPPVEFFQASRRWRLTWLSWIPLLFHAGYHHIHGSPVYWKSGINGPTVYVWPEADNVKAYHYDAKSKFNTKPTKGVRAPEGMPGGFLSISANGSENGILWAAVPVDEDAFIKIVRGALWAFDADTLKTLWGTAENEPADYFDFAKDVPPTIANGKVYLATFSDRINVYGLHSSFATTEKKPKTKPGDPNEKRHRHQ